jgi:hypothetical protein
LEFACLRSTYRSRAQAVVCSAAEHTDHSVDPALTWHRRDDATLYRSTQVVGVSHAVRKRSSATCVLCADTGYSPIKVRSLRKHHVGRHLVVVSHSAVPRQRLSTALPVPKPVGAERPEMGLMQVGDLPASQFIAAHHVSKRVAGASLTNREQLDFVACFHSIRRRCAAT